MTAFETLLTNIGTFIITTPIMLFLGKKLSKNDAENSFYNERINIIVNDIRSLTDNAVGYFTNVMEDRERAALAAVITSTLRRISADISDIVKNTENSEELYMKQWICYYNCITNEPFGDSNFEAFSNSGQVIDDVRQAEDKLIIVLRGMVSC